MKTPSEPLGPHRIIRSLALADFMKMNLRPFLGRVVQVPFVFRQVGQVSFRIPGQVGLALLFKGGQLFLSSQRIQRAVA